MEERIKLELALLRQRYPDLEYREEGRWVRIPSYGICPGWNREATDIAFQIPVGFPGAPPYGIYTPAGLQCNRSGPDNYKEPAPTQPPFGGTWGIFSWTTPDGKWQATAELTLGSTLLNWVNGFADRFREGK